MISMLKRLKYECQFRQLLRKKSILSVEEALNNLYEFYPVRETAPMFKQDVDICIEVDLMIVLPVYNVEEYLVECLESILQQKTKYSYKVVAVNDGSTDNSGTILNRYKKYPQIEIINQNNHGLSAARNRALQTIIGKYVMFVDSDDYLPEDTIEKLLDVAYANKADLVEGDVYSFNEDTAHIMKHRHYGINNMSSSNLFGYAWGKVISFEIMEKICFPISYLYEDTIMSTLVYAICDKICIIPEIVYCYRLNPIGIDATSTANRKAIDTFWLTKYCLEESLDRNIELTAKHHIQYFDQMRLNTIRLKKWEDEIQESIFIVYCDLYKKYFKNEKYPTKKYQWMKKVLEHKSYKAYIFLMEHWDSL